MSSLLFNPRKSSSYEKKSLFSRIKPALFMKTISYFLFFLFLLIGATSCKKEKDSSITTKTKTELLTSKTWVYDEYFTNYNQAGTLVAYKKGKANNSMDLSLNKVRYNADGTYQETTENGTTISGTWKFLNGETQTEVTNVMGTFTSNVISLTETSFIWYDQSVGRYGKMIPQ
jgi:hypothetical protein